MLVNLPILGGEDESQNKKLGRTRSMDAIFNRDDLLELNNSNRPNYSGAIMNEENNDYYCDSCEEPIGQNDEAFEVRYGFICKQCAGH
jgi:hypothetical protein